MKQTLIAATLLVSLSAGAQGWQQQVNTHINVRLDDELHFLHGYEEITYINNSPDTLRFLYIHLWPNAYKHDHTPFAKQQDVNHSTAFYYSKPADKGYIDSLQFTVDGQSVDYANTDDVPDIARVELIKPLLPGGQIKLSTPFRVKIPKVFSRMGHTGQAYYISQWFPKPAVYDHKGWHPIPYLDQGEFFSEYGDYDVQITLPQNYVVMATGNCQTGQENKWLDSLSQLPLPADTLYKKSKPASSEHMKTIRFTESHIHDFAWFADKRWIVRKDTVYSPGNNKLVTAWTAFLPSYQKYWNKSTDYLKITVKYYGSWVGPYQYNTVKAVLGDLIAGGGMEYPTVTIIDRSVKSELRKVIIHEAGHNWFYGMLGSNERDHPWMDEGLNSFYEQKTSEVLSHDSDRIKKGGLNEYMLLDEDAATGRDQPMGAPSISYEKLNYGIDVYNKSTIMLKWLEAYMGPDQFEQGMHDYYDQWHFHHPYPEDFRKCMERHATKPIDWFFDNMLTTDRRIDYTVTKAKIADGKTQVRVRNNSGVAGPVYVEAYNGDSLMGSGWSAPIAHTGDVVVNTTGWTRLKISDVIPDGKSANDIYRRRVLFHHFGVSFRPYLGLNMGDKDKVFYGIAPGYNQYDGFMLGLAFHNLTMPENRFRFVLVPMYGFGSKQAAGAGSVGYAWYPHSAFREILLQADVKSFHDNETLVGLDKPIYAGYLKIAPSLNFTFSQPAMTSPVARTLCIKEYNITENNIDFGAGSGAKPQLVAEQKTYGLIRYKHVNQRQYNPFYYSFEGQGSADYVKLGIEGFVRIDYNKPHKSLYVRGYFGKFFAISGDPAVYGRYELNTSFTGPDDYLYDGVYRGRNAVNGISAQQISMQEGGFKIPTYNNVGRSDNWLGALNLESDLPIRFSPIRLFFDAGLTPNAHPDQQHNSSTTVLYDGGISIHMAKDIVQFYIPVIMSSDFQNYLTNSFGHKNVFTRSLSFSVKLTNLNWLKAPYPMLRSMIGQ